MPWSNEGMLILQNLTKPLCMHPDLGVRGVKVLGGP